VAKYLKDIDNCRSSSGTHGYLAPEVYTAPHTHGRTADWFAVGVTLHEFVIGRRPFIGPQLNAFKDAGHNDTLDTPVLNKATKLSAPCKDFIKKCLARFSTERMGCIDDFEDIKAHPWFKDFDWQAIILQTAVPPFIPNSYDAIYNPEVNCAEASDHIQLHLVSPSIPVKEQVKFCKFSYSIESKANQDFLLLDMASTQFSDDIDTVAD
jgi:serine/threonine protein kinase